MKLIDKINALKTQITECEEQIRALELVNSIESIYNNRLSNGICKIKMSHREYFGGALSNCYFKVTNEYPVKTEFIKEVLDRIKLLG